MRNRSGMSAIEDLLADLDEEDERILNMDVIVVYK